jgi:hypothetical protein
MNQAAREPSAALVAPLPSATTRAALVTDGVEELGAIDEPGVQERPHVAIGVAVGTGELGVEATLEARAGDVGHESSDLAQELALRHRHGRASLGCAKERNAKPTDAPGRRARSTKRSTERPGPRPATPRCRNLERDLGPP